MIPQFDPNNVYNVGFGGSFLSQEGRYKCWVIEIALVQDDPQMLDEVIELKWADADTRCFDNGTLIDRCVQRGAMKCAQRLRTLGWPQVYNS